ncbi:tRNA (N(6)-L-threonylcarbamoyladenosine(37)-C(2))-methylthiotransferase MtaB [Desulfofalx alkaliphila]|uniref:tRNA (N(6)-L-threonylcarbamoyladenosine(37)-C(2))- methylthiotransferase MtaB n=1 Tax=Desulfofalx alkaliphila TaxID=105483 RepID=UPI00054E3871|nr:tRNA (N(6)-L-threonylcarbamoyladenosine(37)-C(2))-methylthiotransferase MtaB [Desulfofalx alkaliphila]
MSQKTVAIHTLGCKVNQTESAAIAQMFKDSGYTVTEIDQPAHVYIINTCTVTHLSDRKSRQVIRRAVKANPDGLVVVTGCYAQTSPGEVIEIPGVDLVVGTADKNKIVQLVEEAAKKLPQPLKVVGDIFQLKKFQEMPTATDSGKTRAFIKVQEGCDNHCAYCIIPYARGPLRSRKIESIVQESKELVQRGFKEIVLTGIHTGAYGLDFKDGTELSTLVKELVQLPGLARLRLSSVEPNDITPELIRVMVQSKVFCNHLHIPLQSGDDQVLKSMRRRYNTGQFAQLIGKIREKIPHIAITTDVIVGFPGETDEMFENTYQYCRQMAFSGMHVFKYSPRRGTPAADFPNQVDAKDKERRSYRLIELGCRLAENYAAKALGKTVEVLAEQRVKDKPDQWEGLTDTYLRVEFSAPGNIKGRLVKVLVTGTNEQRLFGKINQ